MAWRYENPGYRELLVVPGHTVECDSTKSKTGYAFWQNYRSKSFDIPSAKEIWVKFDVYSASGTSNRWRAYHEKNNNDYNGITRYSDQINIWTSGDTDDTSFKHDVKNWAGLHTIILHMVSDASNGIVEYFLDGEKAASVAGKNVNNGNPFDKFFLESDGADVLFSNVIISDTELTTYDTCDLSKKQWIQPVLGKLGNFGVDEFSIRATIEASTVYRAFDATNTNYGTRKGIYFSIAKNVTINHIRVMFFPTKDAKFYNWCLSCSDDDKTYTLCQKIARDTSSYYLSFTNVPYHKYYFISVQDASGKVVENAIFDGIVIDAIEGDTEKNIFFDTRRNVSNAITQQSDTARYLVESLSTQQDTARAITTSAVRYADTSRMLSAMLNMSDDTRRTVSRDIAINTDTVRMIAENIDVDMAADTARNLYRVESMLDDTTRKISNLESINADVHRIVSRDAIIDADTSRTLAQESAEIAADTARQINGIVRVKVNTYREVHHDESAIIDTSRQTYSYFRYENAGFRERLASRAVHLFTNYEESKTGHAFSFLDDNERMTFDASDFPIQESIELYAKFDVYVKPDASGQRWCIGILNGSTDNYPEAGIACTSDTEISVYSNKSSKAIYTSTHTIYGLHTVIFHVVASKDNDGIIEYWYDGEKVTSLTGLNINGGKLIAGLCLRNKAVGNYRMYSENVLFSNVIISSYPIDVDDNCKDYEWQWITPNLISNTNLDDFASKDFAVYQKGYDNAYSPFNPSGDGELNIGDYRTSSYVYFFIKDDVELNSIVLGGYKYADSMNEGKDEFFIEGSNDGVNYHSVDFELNGDFVSRYYLFIFNDCRYHYFRVSYEKSGYWGSSSNPRFVLLNARKIASLAFNVRRNVYRSEIVESDTDRLLGVLFDANTMADTKRLLSNFGLFNFDTSRNQGLRQILFDTYRHIDRSIFIDNDTVRRIPHDLFGTKEPVFENQDTFTPFPKIVTKGAEKGIIDFKLVLEENTLSDKISAEVIGFDYWPEDIIKGTFIDYPYEMKIESTQNTGARQTIDAMHYKDRLLYTSMHYDGYHLYELNRNRNASYRYMLRAQWYVNRIKESLSLHVDSRFSNFTPESNFSDTDITYADLLSGLFGWSSQYPWRLVNVFLRGNTLYILQRGRENSVYDITNLPHTEPQIERSIYYSPYASNNKNNTYTGSRTKVPHDPMLDVKDPDDPDEPDDSEYKDPNDGDTDKNDELRFNGVIYGDHIKQTYYGGLCVEEVHYVDEIGPDGTTYQKVNIVVTRDYDGSDRCTKERSDNADGTWRETNTSYTYGGLGSHSHTEDGDEYGVTQKTDVYTAFLGGSFTGTSTYVDGQFVSSSISGSGIINRTLPYTQNQQNAGLQQAADAQSDDEDEQQHKGLADAKTDPYIPTVDHSIRAQIQKEIDAYDRSIQETVSFDIIMPVIAGKPTMKHIIDFTERVKFNGAEYYLVRNTVEQTVTNLKQSIEITRWIRR